MRTGELGFWWRSLGGPPPLREPLREALEVDVAIVGGGYTGLWTAYYLKRAQPSLRVAILEAQRCGYGASGRNGGWVVGSFSGPARAYGRGAGGAAGGYAALTRALHETVDEVGGVLAEQRIDADFVKGGHLSVALDGAQAQRLRAHVEEQRASSARSASAIRTCASWTPGSWASACASPARAWRRSRRMPRESTRQSSWRGSPLRSSVSARRSTSARR
jgi:glycine/D-amino acid oxidase-like deaminating enzyme